MRMPLRNGMGTLALKLRPSGLENSADSNGKVRPRPTPKKSPSGASTAAVLAPSQYMERRRPRSIFGPRSFSVIQMRRTMPLPDSTAASVRDSPAFNTKNAAPLRPAFALAPWPRSAFGFSGLAQRVSTPAGMTYNDSADA